MGERASASLWQMCNLHGDFNCGVLAVADGGGAICIPREKPLFDIQILEEWKRQGAR
jgi:hypothetical protein